MATATQTPTEVPRLAYSASELARAIPVSERTIRARMASGEIQTIRFFGRILIPASEVERLLTPAPQTEGGTHDR